MTTPSRNLTDVNARLSPSCGALQDQDSLSTWDLEDQVMSDTSDCSVCPLPAPVTIQISEQESTSSYQSDGYLCIDSEDEQDIKTSRLNNDSKLLSEAKQLLDYV